MIERHLTDDYWRTNCKKWLEAIARVRTDHCLTLRVPPVFDPDDEDDFL
jgi:hypothetical protein